MNILFINTYKDWGGDERWTINIGVGLKNKGHQVVIGSCPGLETEKRAIENHLDIFPISIGPDIAFWKIPKIVRYIKKKNFDIVVCLQNRDIKIAALAAKIAGVKLVLGRKALDVMKQKPYHRLAFTKYVDGIITNTQALKDLFMSYGWFNDRFIHPVHDGILVHENVKDIDLRKEFELPKDSFVCVGAGRLVYQKGYDYLIEVAKMAKDQNLNWRFVILGIGRLENQLKKMVSDLQVENYIKFIGFRKDVLPFMKAADLFVLSSRSESMTNVLREAMSVRTACVATDVYGISELIENMKSGIIVEPGSPSAIYNGIKLLANDPKLKSEIEENSYQRILEGFTMQKMIDETEELFTKLLKEQN